VENAGASRAAPAFERVPLDAPVAQALIAALNAELDRLYPEEGANHFRLDADEVAPGRGAFLVGRVDGRAVACGAVRTLEAGTAEIKRMYVDPAVRRRGVARALLARLEDEARALGARRIVLETGVRQPEAIALYAAFGYATIAPFGEYENTPLSVCMGKELR
jgi:GNAT superfamily N-acetyltransferase